MSKRLTITALLITALIASASPVRAFSEMSLRPAPQLNCQPLGSDTLIGHNYRNFTFSRSTTDLEYTFRYRLEDDDYGVTNWYLVPLHPTSKAKRGDKVLSMGTGCSTYSNGNSYSYNPKSVTKVPIIRNNGYPSKWNFEGRIPRVRDEVDSLALIGYNSSDQRVAFHWRSSQFGPRTGGTLFGKIRGLACRVSVIGLPIAQGVYVVSSRMITALELAEIPYADKANLTLQGFAIYAGVDSDGRVTGSFGIKFDGGASDRQKALEYAELAVGYLISELGSGFADEIEVSNPKSAMGIRDGMWTVDAKIYLEDWMSAVDALQETVSETDLDLCKIWD